MCINARSRTISCRWEDSTDISQKRQTINARYSTKKALFLISSKNTKKYKPSHPVQALLCPPNQLFLDLIADLIAAPSKMQFGLQNQLLIWSSFSQATRQMLVSNLRECTKLRMNIYSLASVVEKIEALKYPLTLLRN